MAQSEDTAAAGAFNPVAGVADAVTDFLKAPRLGRAVSQAALERIAGLFTSNTRCIDAVAFSCAQSPDGRVRVGLSMSGSSRLQPLVGRLVENSQWRTGASECFSLGRCATPYGLVEVIAIRISDGEAPVAGGCVAFRTAPTAEEWRSLSALSRLAGAILSASPQDCSAQDDGLGSAVFLSDMNDALRLGADIYWSTDQHATIRKIVVLRPGEKIASLWALEGKDLGKFVSEHVLRDQHAFFDASAAMRTMQGANVSFTLSGLPARDGGWHGIARLAEKNTPTHLDDHNAGVLIDKLAAAREREADMRKEAEVVLDGLRVMTSGKPGREVFSALLNLLAPPLGFDEALIVQREWAGQVTVAVATDDRLAELDWSGAADTLFKTSEVAVSLDVGTLAELPPATTGRVFRSGLCVTLAGGSKPTVMLCLHSDAGYFSSRHLALGTRLSLIASQAFMNEEERQKVVNSSKLATIGEMAAGVVHEINQPLTSMSLAIGNLVDMLHLSDEWDREKILKKLSRVQGQIDRLTKIVGGMRVLSRHSDGMHEPFAIETAILEALSIVQHKLTKASITTEVTVPPELHAIGNPLEFSQVVLNLLGNAHDAMTGAPAQRDPGRQRVISVLAEAMESDWAVLRVRDTGPGFPDSAEQKAFEPFFTTKAAGQGTGLGLALCRRIIENMGGSITLGNWDGGAQIEVRVRRVPL